MLKKRQDKSSDSHLRRISMSRSIVKKAWKFVERETGFEPATSTLARSHSTTELLPLTGHLFIPSRMICQPLVCSN